MHNNGAPTLRLRSEELVVDFHCAICLPGEGKWYRAVLTAVKGDMVEAVLLDFGRVAAASVSKHVRRLMPQFTSPLPAQAVAVRLGGVAPPGAGPWPEESAELLQELTRDACNFRVPPGWWPGWRTGPRTGWPCCGSTTR